MTVAVRMVVTLMCREGGHRWAVVPRGLPGAGHILHSNLKWAHVTCAREEMSDVHKEVCVVASHTDILKIIE